MKSVHGSISRVYLIDSIPCYQFDDSLSLRIQPGQYILACGSKDILATPLFPGGIHGTEFTTGKTDEKNWQPGDLLSIRFPMGKGFSLPISARRLLMVNGTGHPHRLLPAAGMVFENNGEAALYSVSPPEKIPAELELITPEELSDAVEWADCIIGDTDIVDLARWKKMIDSRDQIKLNKPVQVLMDTPMACTGTAECGVCAVNTHRGWKHACTDGPVFSLDELDV